MAEQTTPVGTAPTGALFRALLPERSVEDVLAGVLRVRLGKGTYPVPVLVIKEADGWRAQLNEEFATVVGALDSETNAAGVLAFMGSQTPTMLKLLRSYDTSGVLPDDEWIRANATEPDILRAFMLVMAASYPFIAAALDILAANPGALKIVLEEFGPSTGRGQPTDTSPALADGRSGKSARRSRTSSSRAT